MVRSLFTLLVLAAFAPLAYTQNLLRNADFQDDWLTLLPETKNHHWCYASEFTNRRDFNPDGWTLKGTWTWQNAEQPAGQRTLLVHGPTVVQQRVNWVLVHDSKSMGNLADAGGFPQIQPQRSKQADGIVRDLTLRVLVKGKDVPAKAGSIEVAFCPPGQILLADPFGTQTEPTAKASAPLPEGSFDSRLLEVKLPAGLWFRGIEEQIAKDPKAAAEMLKAGPVLPGTVSVTLRYLAKTGVIEVERAELVEAGPASPNLLPFGGFEVLPGEKDRTDEYPLGWTGPTKYRHFPGRLYYLFNTWHNAAFANRGKVQVDTLVAHSGKQSLQMIVPAGDEMAMTSRIIKLNQKEPRLIEVHALVKTDRLNMLHIEAVDEKGQRLDGFPFIHMAPHSIGTNDWRVVRQVFRPRNPVESVRVSLCARGVNGYTLDDTGFQPQNNVVGTIWWDDVTLYEPETNAAELQARGVTAIAPKKVAAGIQLKNLDLGERLLGENVLSARVHNTSQAGTFTLQWEFVSPTGRKASYKSDPKKVRGGGQEVVTVRYIVDELLPKPYTEYRGKLTLLDDQNETVAATELWFATWSVPIDLDLGALYLRPEQKQHLRLNLGFSAPLMKDVATIKVDVVRRGTGEVLRSEQILATPPVFEAQRQKIPAGLRDDFTNLLLADGDLSFLPLQPFHDPQRNWFVRVSALDKAGKLIANMESFPLCRQAHQPAQPPVQSVGIKDNLLFVNNKPWMPWGVVYGNVPVYDGPADPGKYLNLREMPAWSMYDRFTSGHYSRRANDFNCMRYVAGSITDPKVLEKNWSADNLLASSVFVSPQPAFSLDELEKMSITKDKAGKPNSDGKERLLAYLAFCRTAPMVVSTVPGIEEAFGLFHEVTPDKLKGMEAVVAFLRQQTGKPVMVGHGGYWNRFEFEKVPFFDIFDPETEPLYPANLHTDLWPLIGGKDKAIWLRPQMYEDVPYERWRFHVYVELMRGARGWQIAHGPGDTSLFRGLHGEMEFMKPIAYSPEAGPAVKIQPGMEHWSRQHKGKTYLIAATTRGLTLGHWQVKDVADGPDKTQRARVTAESHLFLSETNSYGADQTPDQGPSIHGIQNLPDAKVWPKGTKLVQWVRVDAKSSPKNLVILAKSDGRWTHAASWGKFDPTTLSKDPQKALWFLRSFYRHSAGFLGWGTNLVDKAKQYMPAKSVDFGDLPGDEWTKLEVPLDKIGATGLLDGVAFAHESGRVYWGKTTLVDPKGNETVVWGDSLTHPPDELAKTRIAIEGLKAGTPVRVLFEDRSIVAQNGFFVDDFRGQDLYQRFGGGYGVGYGDGPVALHVYEIGSP